MPLLLVKPESERHQVEELDDCDLTAGLQSNDHRLVSAVLLQSAKAVAAQHLVHAVDAPLLATHADWRIRQTRVPMSEDDGDFLDLVVRPFCGDHDRQGGLFRMGALAESCRFKVGAQMDCTVLVADGASDHEPGDVRIRVLARLGGMPQKIVPLGWEQ